MLLQFDKKFRVIFFRSAINWIDTSYVNFNSLKHRMIYKKYFFRSSELFPCFSDNDNSEVQYMGRYNITSEDNTKNESSYAFIEDQNSENVDKFLDAIDNFSCRSELKSKESKILVFTTMSDAFTNISSKNFDIFEEGMLHY